MREINMPMLKSTSAPVLMCACYAATANLFVRGRKYSVSFMQVTLCRETLSCLVAIFMLATPKT